MPYREQVHIDAALSNFAERFSQSGIWIADQVLKIMPVKKESDKYFKFYLKDTITLPNRSLRGDGAEASEVTYDLTSTTYTCEEYALRDIVTDRTRKNADAPLSPDQDAVSMLTEKLLNDREYRVASAIFDESTNFVSYTSALTGGDRWDVYATSDPYGDVETAKESVLKNALKPANTIIMGYEVFKKLRHHPDLLDRIKYTGGMSNPAVLNEPEMARAFDVEKVLVGRAIYNSANEGQTATAAFAWGKYVMTCYIAPTPPRKGVTLGMTFRSQPFQTSKWREDKRKGDMIEVSMVDDEVIVTTGAGYLYSTVVS